MAREKFASPIAAAQSAEIDLRYAVTIDDVIKKINETDGVSVTAVADGDALRIVDDTGSTTSNLRIAEVNSGTTAAGLGLGGHQRRGRLSDGQRCTVAA